MQTLSISKFCQTGSGGTPSRARLGDYYEFGKIPWIKSGELAQDAVTSADEFITEEGLKNSSAKLLEPGAILVAMYGATVGQVSQLKILAATNQAICHIYPDKSICYPEYLYWVLKGSKEKLLAKRVGGGQPNISQKILRSFPIPLPPLAEQKRIAGILDAADALRVKRRDAIASLDTLLQSTFLTLFGDPAICLPTSLEKVCTLITDGTHQTPTYSDKGIVFLSSKNVKTGEINWTDIKYIPQALHQNLHKRLSPQRNDILLAKNGTTGTAAIVDRDDVFDIYVSLALLRPKESISPIYLLHAINSDYTAFQFKRALKGVGVPNLHLKEIRKTKIPLPSLREQKHFATIAKSIEKQKSQQRAHLAELDTLFASLQSRAFKGEL